MMMMMRAVSSVVLPLAAILFRVYPLAWSRSHGNLNVNGPAMALANSLCKDMNSEQGEYLHCQCILWLGVSQ